LSLWPNRKELALYFTDYKVVQSARFICKYFPGLALFTFVLQLYFASGLFSAKEFGALSMDATLDALPLALVYGLFIASLPVQALVMLGVKADKFLPPSLASWYRDGIEKVKSSKSNEPMNPLITQLATYKPRYIDLAQLLHLTFATTKSDNL
jgi:uncharacterized membrane protein YfbV (UPF0208 family)